MDNILGIHYVALVEVLQFSSFKDINIFIETPALTVKTTRKSDEILCLWMIGSS